MLKITKKIRKNIFDWIVSQNINWSGLLNEPDFLSRIFDLRNLYSDDNRYDNAYGDIYQHRVNNSDWDNGWVFTDPRFNLLDCEDEIIESFICEILHPVVRQDIGERQWIKDAFNSFLKNVNLELLQDDELLGLEVFKIGILGTQKKNIKEYILPKYYANIQKENIEYPSFFFKKIDWNDYLRHTKYSVYYYPNKSEEIHLGFIKILDINNINTQLKNTFDTLEGNFCSLWQQIGNYENLKKAFPQHYQDILQDLRDVAFYPEIRKKFEKFDGFNKSLLRDNEAYKAMQEAKKVLFGRKENNIFNFNFSTKVLNAETEHTVNFDFSSKDLLPNRIITIIGKNGTGKTQFLANFANSLSGEDITKGSFSPERPLFSRVIAVSYSAFDKFHHNTEKKIMSYKYCGIRNENGLISDEEQRNSLREAFEQIYKHSRKDKWRAVMSNILDEKSLEYFYTKFIVERNYNIFDTNGENILSSGQNILMRLVTEVIAFVRDESLIIFDEPETHLHPNIIVGVIRMIHQLLEEFNSYAIIATHSPLILQEMPSNYVIVFEREGNYPIIRKLDIESFGENLTVLTEKAFNTIEVELTYKEILKKISQKMSYEEAMELFDDKLSFNASIYLRNLYSNK